MTERIKKSKENLKPIPGEGSYPNERLQLAIETGVSSIFGRELKVVVKETPSDQLGEYGINVIGLASQLSLTPAEVANKISRDFSVPAIRNVSVAETILKKGTKDQATLHYVNFELNMQLYGKAVVGQILDMGKDYGKENIGKGEKTIFDTSSPNIAKDMHAAHLRSTIIGDSLSKIYKALGFEVVTDNHIGDWGTQFGKLIYAIKTWSSEQEVLEAPDPIAFLQKLYVKVSDNIEEETEASKNILRQRREREGIDAIPELKVMYTKIAAEVVKKKEISETELDKDQIIKTAIDRLAVSKTENAGRAWFLKLEQGDPDARRIWKMCVDLSLKEFQKTYDILGVNFDLILGESFYEPMLQDVMKEAEKIDSARISDGALIIDMEDKGLGVQLIRTSDGRSLYFTRDVATGKYREEQLKADRLVYVVGADQKSYFLQLFETLKRMGYKVGEKSIHVYFGMVSLPEGKMSTRKGTVILLKDVVKEGLTRAEQALDNLEQEKEKLREEKWQSLSPEDRERLKLKKAQQDEREKDRIKFKDEHKEDIVRKIAVGALKWSDLSQDPRRNIKFDWDAALKFEGNSAPSVQYSAVRAESIMETAGVTIEDIKKNFNRNMSPENFSKKEEKTLVRMLSEYPQALIDAFKQNDPSKVAVYVYALSKEFNNFYNKVSILQTEDEDLKNSRMALVGATYQVIENALNVLGIEVPEAM